MISEEKETQAALYALWLLDADQASAFEREMAGDEELRVLALELSEAAAEAVRLKVDAVPLPGLKGRVLARVKNETRAGDPTSGKVIAGPSSWTRQIPWAIAAMLAICCGILTFLNWELAKEGIGRGRLAIGFERRARAAEAELAAIRGPVSSQSSLRQVAFCALEPVPAAQQAGPQAAVLWDAAKRRGVLRITKLPPADAGKDYQLWSVEDGRKEPVSAGVVKIGPDGSAEIEFQPEGDDGKAPVVAFALSVERAGGVPKSEGQIIYLGKL